MVLTGRCDAARQRTGLTLGGRTRCPTYRPTLDENRAETTGGVAHLRAVFVQVSEHFGGLTGKDAKPASRLSGFGGRVSAGAPIGRKDAGSRRTSTSTAPAASEASPVLQPGIVRPPAHSTHGAPNVGVVLLSDHRRVERDGNVTDRGRDSDASEYRIDGSEAALADSVGGLLTSVEVARIIRVPHATLRYWRHIGLGPRSFKMGPRRVCYREDDVRAWVAEQYGGTE